MKRRWLLPGLSALTLCAFNALAAGQDKKIQVQQTDEFILIDTDLLQAKIRKQGYVSGIAQGSLLDRQTGAKDPGFGLHIMDFLMAPGWKDDGYSRDPKLHGNLPKHYVEGPQVCTQAKKLEPAVRIGKSGLTEGILTEISKLLDSKSLIKIKLLRTSFNDRKKFVEDLVLKTRSELIESVGNVVVLYRK